MFKRRAKNPDAVTTREIVGLYSFEQVTLARKAHAADRIGDVARRDMLLDQARIGMRDAILIVDRVRPIFTPEQVAAGRAAMVHLDVQDFDAAEAILDPLGVDANDLGLMQRLGFLDGALPAEEEPDEEPLPAAQDVEPVRGHDVEPALAPTTSASPRNAPGHTLEPGLPEAVELPDGSPLNEPGFQGKVEEWIRQSHGQHAVLMWPRYPDVEDGVKPIVDIVDSRPQEQKVPLGPAAKPSEAPVLAAKFREAGFDLVEFSPRRGYAIGARLSDETRAIRDRLAKIIQRPANEEDLRPWEVEVACHHVTDPETGKRRLDQVVILRMQEVGADIDKRQAHLTSLIRTLPGGSDGWEALDDFVSGTARLRYGQPRALPASATYEDIGLEPVIRRDLWHLLPFGINPEGKVSAIDLKSGPHIGVGGATGAGKSVTIRALLTGALLHGMDIAVIDPKKSCGDFRAFEDYAIAWGDDTLEQAADIMDSIYVEGARRKAVLKQMRLPDIWEMSQAERDQHNIRPLLVVFDEFQAATIPKDVPKGVKAGDPLLVRAQTHNYSVARIQNVGQSGVLELRFVGIHFLFAGQVVSAQAFGSALRANLPSVIYAVPKIGGIAPKREILGMQFGDSASDATDLITTLRSREPGLALFAGEDGAVDGCRVALGRPDEITALLEAAGVPKPSKMAIEGSSIEPEPVEGELIAPAPAAAVMVLGEIALSLDDLADFENDEPAVEIDVPKTKSRWEV